MASLDKQLPRAQTRRSDHTTEKGQVEVGVYAESQHDARPLADL